MHGMKSGEGFDNSQKKKALQEKEAAKIEAKAALQKEIHQARNQLIEDCVITSEFNSERASIKLAVNPLIQHFYLFWQSGRQDKTGELSCRWNVLNIKPRERNAFLLTQFDKAGPGEPANRILGQGYLKNGNLFLKIESLPWIEMRSAFAQGVERLRPKREDPEHENDLTEEDFQRLRSDRALHMPRLRA
jgi:hypothetical protein